MEGLPKMLQYKTIKPKGFPNDFKRWELLPQSSSANYNLQDTIRFSFQTDWYFDPYQTYMDIQVEFPQDDQNMGIPATKGVTNNTGQYSKKNISDIPVYSLDGPATSLISEMVLFSNGREVERIQEYDVLGNLIADLGVPNQARPNKAFEGYHYTGALANYNQFQRQQVQSALMTTGVTSDQSFPSFGHLSQVLSHEDVTNEFVRLIPGEPSTTASLATGKYFPIEGLLSNTFMHGSDSDVIGVRSERDDISRSNFRNYAREYVLQDGSMGVDHTITRNSAPIHINQTVNQLNTYSQTQLSDKNLLANKRVVFNHESSVNQFDYMCPGVQAIKYQNGVYQDSGVRGACETINVVDIANQQKLGVYKQTFHVPILSAVMGHLIPNSQWSLIPGKGCGNMVWEFRLNKYAFFASGHMDNQKPADEDGVPEKQFNMNWRVTNISINFDLWNFDQSVNDILTKQMLSTGLMITSQGFTLGPVQTILNTSQLRGNYSINNGILSLRAIYLMFLLNDYQKLNYCAKNFRISQNIKSMQLKIGNDFIPKQAITGNAGNITSNLGVDDDVYPFLMELYRSQGEMFNPVNQSSITPFNFCLNDRIYNPYSRIQTSCQQALLHEQRARGKAVYTIDMQADPFDDSVLTGYNTTIVRPIELLLDANINEGIQNRTSTMYVWLHHDTIVQFTADGIVTIAFG